MVLLPRLNLPKCKFRVKKKNGDILVWDELRKIWCKLTPEEWVRRHTVNFILNYFSVPATSVHQECPVSIQGQNQRADIVVYNNEGQPYMLVECKSPDITIDAAVYAQAVRYNTVLKARYLMLTNGLVHYFYEMNEDFSYTKLEAIPVSFMQEASE